MPTRHGHMIKQPTEELDRAVDFGDRLLNSASIEVGSIVVREITSQTAHESLEPDDADEGEDDLADDMIADDPAPFVQNETKIIQFRVIGGEAGIRYKIEVSAEGDDGQIAEYDLYVDVLD